MTLALLKEWWDWVWYVVSLQPHSRTAKNTTLTWTRDLERLGYPSLEFCQPARAVRIPILEVLLYSQEPGCTSREHDSLVCGFTPSRNIGQLSQTGLKNCLFLVAGSIPNFKCFVIHFLGNYSLKIQMFHIVPAPLKHQNKSGCSSRPCFLLVSQQGGRVQGPLFVRGIHLTIAQGAPMRPPPSYKVVNHRINEICLP